MAAVSSPELEIQSFFDALARRRRGVLVIDFDSTIAQVGNSERGYPYPTAPEVLDSIVSMTGTRVVVISARPVGEVRGYFAQPGPEIWGCCDMAALDLDALGGSFPLAYLKGGKDGLLPAHRLRVCPRFWNGQSSAEGAPAEDLVQFLIEWLRACTGEIC